MEDFDKELLHYAKGQTKKNAKYKSRKMVNGRWVYEYRNNTISRKMAEAKEYDQSAIDSGHFAKDISKVSYDPNDQESVKKSLDLYEIYVGQQRNRRKKHAEANKAYSTAESLKRKQASSLARQQRKQKAANQAAREREKQQAAKESAKRMQQSALAAKQRRKAKEVVRKYANKGKSLVKNLISKIYSEETTITDVSTGKTRKTNVEFYR